MSGHIDHVSLSDFFLCSLVICIEQALPVLQLATICLKKKKTLSFSFKREYRPSQIKRKFTSFLFYTDVYFPIYYLGDGNTNKSKANKIKESITFLKSFSLVFLLCMTQNLSKGAWGHILLEASAWCNCLLLPFQETVFYTTAICTRIQIYFWQLVTS